MMGVKIEAWLREGYPRSLSTAWLKRDSVSDKQCIHKDKQKNKNY